MKFSLLCVVFLLTVSPDVTLAVEAAATRTQGESLVEPFDYRPVTLDGGFMKRHFDQVRAYYMAISNDSILYQFRRRAGLPSPGEKLVGAAHGGASVDKFGQWLSGFARMYASTREQAIYEKVNRLVVEWEKTIAPDGYFYATENEKTAPAYRYEKAVGGLVDAYLYCGRNPKALSALSRITDWAVQHLDRARKFNDFTPGPGLEWYTVSESLYRAYVVTGDTKYRDFAKVWEYPEYWDLYARGKDIFERLPFDNRHPNKGPGGWYHAYSHVNTLSGAAAAYQVTGEERYLDTIRNAYDFLQETQVYATGAFGPEERLLPNDQRVRALSIWPNAAETQCGSWAGFKLSKYLISFTGDARYGDWIERLIFNSIGASIPMSKEGHVFYHASYSVWGYAKHNVGFPWACCTGTRPQAASDFVDLIYFKDQDHLYVNLFAPSTVNWQREEGEITVSQKTDFPESPNTEFVFSMDRAAAFSLKLRAPGWLAGPITASVNGEKVEVETDQHHWAAIHRRWKDGDRLAVSLPMGLWLSRLDTAKKDGFPAAILFGPVVLAASPSKPDPSKPGNGYKGTSNPSNRIDFEALEKALVPVAGRALTYRLAADPAVEMKPFYDFEADEIYYLYLDPDATNRFIFGHSHVLGVGPSIVFTEEWENMGLYNSSNVVGATATLTFDGVGIRWLGCKYDDGGKAQIKIDGKLIEVVDQYGPGRDLPFNWEYRGLVPGKHTITLTVTGKKSAESKSHSINLTGFEVVAVKTK